MMAISINYRSRIPFLQSHGVSAMFFLATSYVGSNVVPWCGIASHIVKKSKRSKLRLRYPESRSSTSTGLAFSRNVSIGAEAVSQCENHRPRSLERELAGSVRRCRPPRFQQLFMNWDQAREMQAGGMEFSSPHTVTPFSTLSPEAQREGSALARIMEREMGRAIDVMAYPVGSRTPSHRTALRAEGDRLSRGVFAHGGFNRSDDIQPFDIRRFPVDRPSRSRLRLQTAIGAFTASRWF